MTQTSCQRIPFAAARLNNVSPSETVTVFPAVPGSAAADATVEGVGEVESGVVPPQPR
ncbi:Uncharacterised protein [Mycobacteroides abscessus subsp. abscessus]|nr:Uncharacterised protein [Mycobacteroides abscessus subsp. abscessus]